MHGKSDLPGVKFQNNTNHYINHCLRINNICPKRDIMKSLKNVIKFIHNRIQRVCEIIKLVNSKPNNDAIFYIVSPFYNSNFDTIKCLDSVYKQDFS